MDELLQKLLENDLLTEDTKGELEEAIQSQVNEAVEAAVAKAKEETETEVRAELAEQFVVDKEALVEAIDTKIDVFLEKELEELKGDIEAFRDLEAEFAEKTVEQKKQLAETAKKDFAKLVDILDEYLNEAVENEFNELREEIEEVRKLRKGQKIFEAFKDEFEAEFFDADEMNQKAEKAEADLEQLKAELNEAREQLADAERKQVVNEALSNLEGKPREVMAAILEKVDTDKVPAVYEQFIGRVLSKEETVKEDAEKEETVLAENSEPQSDEGENLTETVGVSGDTDGPVVESVEDAESTRKLSKDEDLQTP
jgi:DNA repair exonuclease SbcCD ATPase subunit